MKIRSLKFWGRLCAESLGIAIGISMVWLLFMGLSSGEYAGDIGRTLAEWLPLYCYYLLMTGALVLMIMGITYFQVYFPVVLSMNATRKSIAIGILGCMLGIAAGVLLLSAIIWRLVPGEISASGWKLMPLFIGALLSIAAFGLILGVAVGRWGKAGLIMTGVLFGLIGGGAGMSVALFNKSVIMELVNNFMNRNFHPLAVAGIILFAAVSLLVLRATRKMEVRA